MNENENMNQQENIQNPYQQQAQNPYEQQAQNPYQQPVQNPYEQQAQNPYQQPVQNPYEQQTQNPYQVNAYQPVAENVPVKKKGKKALIAVLIVVGVIALGIGSAFVFAGDYMKNLIARYTKSDADYFVWVERNNYVPVKESEETDADNLMNQLTDILEQGIKGNTELSVKVGGKLAEGLGLEGLGRVSLKQNTEFKDEVLGLGTTLAYEGTDVISLETILDFAKANGYLRIPELSDAYIDFSDMLSYGDGQNVAGVIKSIPEFLKSQISEDKLSADFINECVEKYYFKSLELIENVEKINSEKFIIGDEETTCTKITLDVTVDDLKRIGKYIAETVANDDALLDYILSYLPQELNINKTDIADALKDLAAELGTISKNESVFKLEIYVNRSGNIIGRNIRVGSEQGEFSLVYGDFSEGDDINFNASIKMAGLNIVKFSSKGTTTDGKLNGRATIEVPMASLIFGTASSKFAVYIDYNDMITSEDNLAGKIAISVDAPESMTITDGLALADLSLLFNYDIQKNSVGFNFSTMYKGEEQVNFSISSNINKMEGNVKLPDSSSRLIDYEDDDALAEEITFEKVIALLQDVEAKIDSPFVDALIESLINDITPRNPIVDPGPIVDPDPVVDPDPIVDTGKAEIDTSKDYHYTYEKLADYITLGKYEGHELDVDCTVEDEEVENYIYNERLYESMPTDVIDGGIQNDDIILVDYSVSVLGVELDDYSETDEYITVGSEWNDDAIKMFEEYVIGKNVGDVIEVQVDIPEDFGDFAAGLKADVTINIKDATRYIVPEYNDEFIKSKGFDSKEEYEKSVRAELEKEKFTYLEYSYINDLLEMIAADSQISEIPEAFYQEEVERLKNQYEKVALDSGMDLYEYYETTYAMSADDFDDLIRYQAEDNISSKIVFAGIAKANNIYLTGKEYKDIVQSDYLGDYYWSTYEDLLEYYTEQQLVDEIIENILKDYLIKVSVLNGAPTE